MKRGQKLTKNQKRRNARALRLIQDPTTRVLDVCERVFGLHPTSTQHTDAAHNLYHLQGSKADLITLKLWS
jgi:hypothetical protein